MTEFTDCPNCGTKLKGGIVSSVKLLNENKVSIINEYHETKAIAYCSKCGSDLYFKYENKLVNERNELSKKIQLVIDAIPVVSTHSPLN